MIRRLLYTCACAAAALAQPPEPPKTASVSGVVRDSVSGRPLADFTVSTYAGATYVGDTIMMSGARNVSSTTDQQGRYRLADLPPGDYRITAQPPRSFVPRLTRHIVLAGRDLESIDFPMTLAGTITGRVLDENREPIPGMTIRLVSREYYSGVVGYFIKGIARSDDRGVYVLERIEAGHPYLVMAESLPGRLEPRSDAPLDPKLRRRVPMRTFYPNSPDRESASPVVLRPGETHEGVDIEIRKAQSYCVEGTASGLAGPASLFVIWEGAQPAFGTSSTGGVIGMGPTTKTGPDGKFRFCGLAPGQYRLAAFDGYQGSVNRALLPVEIRDRDLVGVNLTVGPGLPLQGEVVWDGAAPPEPVTAQVSVSLNPLLRGPIANERAGERAAIPGPFTLNGILPSDYNLRAFLPTPGLYVKDVQYGGQSILYAPLRFGSAPANLGVRVIVARDGARLTALVQDKDGNPLGDIRVLVLPADISSEAMLQSALISGQTNQVGRYTSQTLCPGKYLVLATQEAVNPTPESIDNLWQSRNRFREVELPAGGSAQVTLEPITLR